MHLKFDCDGWAAILILSNIHVVLHKVFLFSGEQYFMSGDHLLILGCQKATLEKVELGALYCRESYCYREFRASSSVSTVKYCH